MSQTVNRDLDHLPVKTLFWRYAIPSVIGMLVTGLYAVIDGIFVGHYVGAVGLAAINLAYPAVMVQIGLAAMLGMGAATRIAMLRGAKQYPQARQTLISALLILLLLGVVVPLLAIPHIEQILLWLNADHDLAVKHEAQSYLWWMMAGTLVNIGPMLLTCLVRNDGRPRLATGLMVLGAILNIILDYIFVGKLGLGLAGAAQATLIAEGVLLLLALAYFFSRHARLRLALDCLRPDWQSVRPIVVLGISSLLMELNLALLLFSHNFQLLRWGDDISVAAYAIAGYSESMFTLLLHGLAIGLQPVLSHAMGAARPERAAQALGYGIRVCLLIGFAALLIIQLFPASIASLYSDGDASLIAAGSHALRLHLFALPLDGLVLLGSIALQSMGMTRQALLLTSAKTVLLLFSLWLLPTTFGLNGVWLAMPVVNVLLGIAVSLLLWRAWQHLQRPVDLGQTIVV